MDIFNKLRKMRTRTYFLIFVPFCILAFVLAFSFCLQLYGGHCWGIFPIQNLKVIQRNWNFIISEPSENLLLILDKTLLATTPCSFRSSFIILVLTRPKRSFSFIITSSQSSSPSEPCFSLFFSSVPTSSISLSREYDSYVPIHTFMKNYG